MTNPYAPPQAEVRDTVDPALINVPANPVTRLGAMILDGIIAGAMIGLPFGIIAVMAAAADRDGATGGGLGPVMIVLLLLCAAGAIAWTWLTILFVARNGQTIAKKMLHIKVVRKDGSRASLGRIFWLRNVVNGFAGLIPFYGIVDVLFIFGRDRQCLHDKIADTIVVVEPKA
jgi:uncharacterized RDD family membrane protein YckC